MALAVYDRIQETTTTAGTGSVTLAGAVAGYQTFAVVGNGNTVYYCIVDGNAWEVGVGTYSTTGPSLARTTVLSNSNGNTSAITLSSSANTKTVFCTYPAEKNVSSDQIYAPNTFQGTFVDGVVVDYTTGNARISTGSADTITFYNGGVANTQLAQISTAGTFTASNLVASNGMLVHSATVSASYSIPAGDNAIAVGPVTVASGAAVTIPSGSRWLVL